MCAEINTGKDRFVAFENRYRTDVIKTKKINRKIYILDENPEACDCSIDCQVINTVKAQKRMEGIIKIVHLPTVVQSELYEETRIPFVHKENKNNDFILGRKLCMLFCVICTTRVCCFRSNQSVNKRRRCIRVVQLNSPKWRYADAEETNCWIKLFLCIQKVFSSLHRVQIESLMADGVSW